MASIIALLGFIVFLITTILLVLAFWYNEYDCNLDANKDICTSAGITDKNKHQIRKNILTKKYTDSTSGNKTTMLIAKSTFGFLTFICLIYFIYSKMKSSNQEGSSE